MAESQVTDEDVRRVCDAGGVDYGSVRYQVRDALQEMLDLRRSAVPAKLVELFELTPREKEARARAWSHAATERDQEVLAEALDRAQGTPAAPASPDGRVLVEQPDEDLWSDVDYLLKHQPGGESRRIADWVHATFSRAPTRAAKVESVDELVAKVSELLRVTERKTDAWLNARDALDQLAARAKEVGRG
jgi:hypothetical protein